MKNLKNTIAIALFMCFAFSISCSNDEIATETSGESEMMARTRAEIDSMATVYFTITRSTTYSEFKGAKKLMAKKLNGNAAPLESKIEFAAWLRNNLASTEFATVDEALDLYDLGITKSVQLMDQNPAFYVSLKSYTQAELFVIFAPEYVNPPMSKETPCIEFCMDFADAAFDANEAQWGPGMNSWNPIIVWLHGQYYEASQMATVATYQTCVEAC